MVCMSVISLKCMLNADKTRDKQMLVAQIKNPNVMVVYIII